MTNDELCRLLGDTELFHGLDAEDLRRLAAAGAVSDFPAAAVLMREGAPSESLLVILDGEVQVLKEGLSGRDHELATVGRGTVLGEVGLLESVPRTATAKALQPSRCFVLERAAFTDLLSAGEPAAQVVLLAVARALALRIQAMNDRLVRLLEDGGRARRSPELESFREALLRDWDY